jgi:hypothetical protein
MAKSLREEELLFFSELRTAGIPLDEEVLEATKAASRGLSLIQIGTSIESGTFDLIPGGTGYMLSVAICNDSNCDISLHDLRLKIPWSEPQFHWLEDPLHKVPREFVYSFPEGGPMGFDRDVVLNHRIDQQGKLYPGDCLEGLLLGVGQERAPVEYRDRQRVQTRLSVFDERGNRYDLHLNLLMSRGQQPRLDSVKESPRCHRNLFDKADEGESNQGNRTAA